MKVGTDGVLLGAWANICSSNRILDIGTGTGLIALILAQRTTGNIDAVEVDYDSYVEAQTNINNSKWKNRITLFNSSFQDFYTKIKKKYDLIITNPPYFSNSLKSVDNKKNIARHNDMLPLSSLFAGVSGLLNEKGLFCMIAPYNDSERIINDAKQYKLFCTKQTIVKTTPGKAPKRILMEFRKTQDKITKNIIVIEQNGRHKYSEEYMKLTGDFYLNMQ